MDFIICFPVHHVTPLLLCKTGQFRSLFKIFILLNNLLWVCLDFFLTYLRCNLPCIQCSKREFCSWQVLLNYSHHRIRNWKVQGMDPERSGPHSICQPLCAIPAAQKGSEKINLSILSRQERVQDHHSSKYIAYRAARREGVQVWCKATHPTASLACIFSAV